MLTKALPLLLFFIFNLANQTCQAQKKDTIKNDHRYGVVASITNNGISLIPSFSLGKPAVSMLMSYASGRVSIENDVRFALDGKPWNFLLWARYNLLKQGKFRMNTGANLSLNFRTDLLPLSSPSYENTVVRRYVATELSPTYQVTKNISFGTYYLYTKGIDAGTVKNTHFLTLNATFSQIPICNDLNLLLRPQCYYLYQDRKKGYYFNAVCTLSKHHFPLSVSSIINEAIHTHIMGSKDFVWNVSLVYSLWGK